MLFDDDEIPMQVTSGMSSIFLGIIIGMFYKDHDPPHFHAAP